MQQRRMITWLFETPRFVQGMASGTVVGLLVVALVQLMPTASALSLNARRNCDDNAVIHCGALTAAELTSRYSNSGVAAIYDYFGITAADINAIGTTAVAGQVSSAGTVTVNGEIVATGAMTAGRQDIPGSAKVTSDGVTFYARPPKVSFASSPLSAFVVMKNGRFAFAILGSCGNPVTANAVKPPTPTPVTPPPTPTPPVTTTTSTPPTTVATPPSPPTPTTSLPSTGPGNVLLVALFAVAGGTLLHFGYHYWRLKRTLSV